MAGSMQQHVDQHDPEMDGVEPDEEWAPQAGRKPRRRRHRKNKSALTGDEAQGHDLLDENGSSHFSELQAQHGGHLLVSAATGPVQLHRNVVTWSDLGGDCILKDLSGTVDRRRDPAPAKPNSTPWGPGGTWEQPTRAVTTYPPAPAPCMLPAPIASVAPLPQVASQHVLPEWTNDQSPSMQYWLYNGGQYAQHLVGSAASPAATAAAVGKTAPAELAKLLQDLATEAYED